MTSLLCILKSFIKNSLTTKFDLVKPNSTFLFTVDKYENATFYERLILLEKEWKCAPVLLHRRGCLPEVSVISLQFLERKLNLQGSETGLAYVS